MFLAALVHINVNQAPMLAAASVYSVLWLINWCRMLLLILAVLALLFHSRHQRSTNNHS